MKQFLKTLIVEDNSLKLVYMTFPGFSYDKIEVEVFDWPKSKCIIKAKNFLSSMIDVEKERIVVVEGISWRKKVNIYKDLSRHYLIALSA